MSRGGNESIACVPPCPRHSSWCFKARVVRTASKSGSKTCNRMSCKHSRDMDTDRDRDRHVPLEAPSVLPDSGPEMLFFRVCLSLGAGTLMFLAVTGYKHGQRMDGTV